MKQKDVNILMTVTVWSAAFCFVILSQLKNGHLSLNPIFTLSESIILTAWFAGNYYMFYSFLVPGFFTGTRFRCSLIFTSLFLFISPLIILTILFLNNLLFSAPSSGIISLWGYMGGFFGTIVTGLSGASVRITVDLFKQKQLQTELENKNLESELSLLKARLNPHFLFNTINNIDTLINENPERASDLLSKLSDLLRYVIYDTEIDKAEIADEIVIIEKYVELQKIRIIYPENIVLNISVDKLYSRIPTMLFLPFIENAFKYCDLNKIDQGIKILLSDDFKVIRFNCKNNFTINNNPDGVGLKLAKRRLELYYPEAFTLDIKDDNGIFEVNLVIDLNEN